MNSIDYHVPPNPIHKLQAAIKRETSIVRSIKQLEPLCIEAVKHNTVALKSTPYELMTTKVLSTALRCAQTGSFLRYVPASLISKEFLLRVLKRFPNALEHLPCKSLYNKLDDVDLCVIVAQAPSTLYCIPTSRRTKEICHTALASSSIAFHAIPQEILDESMAILLVNKTRGTGLHFLPIEACTRKVSFIACLHDLQYLDFIPEEHITKAFLSLLAECWRSKSTPGNVKSSVRPQ